MVIRQFPIGYMMKAIWHYRAMTYGEGNMALQGGHYRAMTYGEGNMALQGNDL